MTTPVQSLPDTMTLQQLTRFLTDPSTNHPSFPVIDAAEKVLGVIDPPTVLAWRRNGAHRNVPLTKLLIGQKSPVAYPDEYLERLSIA